MSKDLKISQVFRRSDAIYIMAVRRTDSGGISSPKIKKLRVDECPDILGRTIREALSEVPSFPIQLNLAVARNEYLDALRTLGFRSSGAFEKNDLLVAVNINNGTFEIVPHRRAELGGFEGVQNLTRPLDISDEALGTLISAIFLQMQT